MSGAPDGAPPARMLRVLLTDLDALGVGLLELARRCEASNRDGRLGAWLRNDFVPALEDDQRALLATMRALGVPRSRVKLATAWAAEKAGRAKLNGTLRGYSPASRVVELQGLLAGVTVHSGTRRALAAAGLDLRGEPACAALVGPLEELLAEAVETAVAPR